MLGYPIVRQTKTVQGRTGDQYIGTFGAGGKSPVDSKLPHYNTLPAANKGDWLRITSDISIGSMRLHTYDEIICLEDGVTANDSSKWEIRQYIGATASPYLELKQNNHGFLMFQVLRKVDTGYTLASTQSPPLTLGNYLVIKVIDKDMFGIAKQKACFYAPDHGLGDDDESLYLSGVLGELTTTEPEAKQVPERRLMIATIITKDWIRYEGDTMVY
jgi:hypothetical protein